MSTLYDFGSYGILIVVSCLFVEGFVRLPLLQSVERMRHTLIRVRFILGAAFVSDHWKERALLAYAGKLWMDSAILFLLLMLLALPLGVFFSYLGWLGVFNLDLLNSPGGLACATLAGTLYAILRSRSQRSTDG